jgi:cell division protein FtsN
MGMSKNSNRPSNGNGRGEFPVFAGILLGIVMGLALAGAIAWFILKKNPAPLPPVKETASASKPPVIAEKPVNNKPAASGTASATPDGKARFEFYKELTDKPDSGKNTGRHDTALLKPAPAAKATEANGTYFLQEGAYTNMDDAEKVKAKLALLGLVANIQPANIPDKGMWYRVRLGPYKSTADMNEALASLKLNGLNAAPIKAQ